MPHVVFEATLDSEQPTVEVDAPAGARLVDLCDASNAPVPFSCRSASCGTCRVDVLEGAGLLEPPRDDELEILEMFYDDPARRRLCCQARLAAGEGTVRLRASFG